MQMRRQRRRISPTATNFGLGTNRPSRIRRAPPAVDRPRAALVARSLLCATAAVGCARPCLRRRMDTRVEALRPCASIRRRRRRWFNRDGGRGDRTVVRPWRRYESRLGVAEDEAVEGAASAARGGWPSHPNAISSVCNVFGRPGGRRLRRGNFRATTTKDARRPHRLSPPPRRRVQAEDKNAPCPLLLLVLVHSSGPLDLLPQMVKTEESASDRRPPASRDHRPPRRPHGRPPHPQRSSSSTPDYSSPSGRRDDSRCPPPAEQHASASEQPNAFDVNSFLQKTLSNFRLDETELTAPSAEGTDAGKKAAKRQPTKLSRQSSTSDAAPLLAPSSMPIFAVVSQNGSLRPPSSVKQSMTPSLSKGSLISLASSSRPLCRICHLQNDSPSDPLIFPCRCSGTMQFVHTSCLVHWLEISTKKMCPSPRCELCGYFYKTRHCFNLQRVHLPHLDGRDKVLHTVFLLVFAVMVGCSVLSVLYLQGEPQSTRSYRASSTLTTEDLIVIICSVLFFCAFFVAVFTQYRAEASVCRVAFRCLLINRNWRIRNYDRRDDPDLVWIRPAPPDKLCTDNIV
uniref:RING-CH-type domain-containing protein n=1 Tax=Plectus sambesii TaxID=2011161 RepID=A0A914XKI9_9BILA